MTGVACFRVFVRSPQACSKNLEQGEQGFKEFLENGTPPFFGRKT